MMPETTAGAEAMLALAVVRALVAETRPEKRLRVLKRIADTMGDLSVIPLAGGDAGRQAMKIRALWTQILPDWLEPR